MSAQTSWKEHLRCIKKENIEEVSALHCRCFPESFLTYLGPEAARRYYEWLLDESHQQYAVWIEHQGGMAGFLFGGRYRGAMSGFIRRHFWFLFLRALSRPGFLIKQDFRRKALQGIRSFLGFPSRTASRDLSDSFGILAVASNPALRGRGVGLALMEAAFSEARNRGFKKMHLSVHQSNQNAIGFYEKLGWKKIAAEDGCWTGQMSFSAESENVK